MLFFLIIGLVIIWFEQLRTLAATLVLVAVALAIATRGFLLNIIGSLFRSGAHIASIGDRIEIGDHRGDVIDHSLLGVTILEIGPGSKTHQYTGQSIFIPNSKFLSSSIKNETYLKDYVFHVITIPLKAEKDWQRAEQALLRAANEVSFPYLNEARHYLKTLKNKHGLDTPPAEPGVLVHIPKPDEIHLLLRVPVPVRRRSRLEQEILRKYLLYVREPEQSEGKEEKIASC